MSDSSPASHLRDDTDISATDLDVLATDAVSETGDPEAYDDGPGLGGTGDPDQQAGGAG